MRTSLPEKLESRAIASFLHGAYFARVQAKDTSQGDEDAAKEHGANVKRTAPQQSDIVSIVRRYSPEIKNGRTLQDILNHLIGETEETQDEIAKIAKGERAGDDGVVGEAIDMIQCGIDLIFSTRPDISDEEIADIMENKCEKWYRLYSSPSSLVRGRLRAAHRLLYSYLGGYGVISTGCEHHPRSGPEAYVFSVTVTPKAYATISSLDWSTVTHPNFVVEILRQEPKRRRWQLF